MKLRYVLIAASIAFCTTALAADKPTLPQIVEQQRSIAADIAAGKTKDMKPKHVAAIQKAQQQVFSLTDGKTELSQLSPTERRKLKNALEDVNAALAGTFRAEELKDVCWREQVLGSRMTKMRCATQEELRTAREGARGYNDRPHACALGACSETHGPSQGPNL